jgi:hypothetical protein
MAKLQHPLAFCRRDGFFPSMAFALAEGASVTIQGINTTCPKCGGASEILPGAYEAFGDRLQLLLDPSISHEALLALRPVVELLQRSAISLDEAKRRAEAVVPNGGRLFDIGSWSDQAKATFYAAIIGAIAVVVAAKLASATTQINIASEPAVERVVPRPAPKGAPLPGLPGGPPLRT